MIFEYYTIVEQITGGGVARKEVDIPIQLIRDGLLEGYKKKVGIDATHIVVKLSDYLKESPYIYHADKKKLEALNVKYAIIDEYSDSTPHGSIERAIYQGEATEQDYKVEKALNVICKLIDDK